VNEVFAGPCISRAKRVIVAVSLSCLKVMYRVKYVCHSVALVLSPPVNGVGVSAGSDRLGDSIDDFGVHDNVEAVFSSPTLSIVVLGGMPVRASNGSRVGRWLWVAQAGG